MRGNDVVGVMLLMAANNLFCMGLGAALMILIH